MDNAYLFGIASQRNAWLTARQTVVAENVANANTPGYKTKEIAPFEDVMKDVGLRMTASTDSALSFGTGLSEGIARTGQEDWSVKTSDKSVTLEKEMLKGGEISRDYSLNSQIMRAFHRMIIETVKG
ncbi:flagellar basal body protein [Jiella sp. MQZ9-1]|uniref:Flagellar basal body rod protein FlgB n=1 Tax=Jiella flava TaxID=2816857 RepID=A0A939JUH1_9HYPH|nr:flagellar basal body protein [Jiella flava]MBO0660952.1 flagellar basal body rod protein FlgB [Jiella flava]MCD2469600.1 flagellar basal body protein [Jiella flava]